MNINNIIIFFLSLVILIIIIKIISDKKFEKFYQTCSEDVNNPKDPSCVKRCIDEFTKKKTSGEYELNSDIDWFEFSSIHKCDQCIKNFKNSIDNIYNTGEKCPEPTTTPTPAPV